MLSRVLNSGCGTAESIFRIDVQADGHDPAVEGQVVELLAIAPPMWLRSTVG